MLRNIPVVFGQRQIGFFQDALFDQTRKRVCAFIVSCGMRGKKIVPAQRVRMIAEGFILIDGLEKYRHSDKQQTTLFVRDTTGLLVGRVTDYAIDPENMEVLAVEMIPGYGIWESRRYIWVYAYSIAKDCDELSVPMDLMNQSLFSREGDNACEYPP